MQTRTWQTILGATALLATLALTSPGVQLARAGEGDSPAAISSEKPPPAANKPEPARVAPPPEAPACRPTTGVEAETRSDLAVLRLQQQLAAQAAALAAAAGGDSTESEGIVLNNRGYHYGNPRSPRAH